MKLISHVLILAMMITILSSTAFAAPATGTSVTKTRTQENNVQNALSIKDQQAVDGVIKADSTTKDLEDKIKDAETSYSNQLERFKTRLRAMYENSNNGFMDQLIKSKSIYDFYQKLEVMALITKKDKDMLRELDMSMKEIESNKRIKAELSKSRESDRGVNIVLASRNDMQSEITKRQQTLSLMERNEDELIQKSQDISADIRKMQGAEEYIGGTMKWPGPSTTKITSVYGMRFHPILKKSKLHTGIDLATPYGSSIIAANGGKVVLAEYCTGYGKTVVLDHGGKITTLYGHLSTIIVRKGQVVEAGQVIAKSGNTGWSTGPHLHFEVRKDGETSNPSTYVSPG